MIRRLAFSGITLIALSGCAAFSELRQDFRDSSDEPQATVGGAWPEGGLLDDSEERARSVVGHDDRRPASLSARDDEHVRDGSWVDEERAAANKRDRMRSWSEDPTQSSDGPTPPPRGFKKVYKNGWRATRADFVDESKNEGSLWAGDGQTNFFFSKNKVRTVGDIITITTEEPIIRDISAEIGRTLTPKERSAEIDSAQARLDQDSVKSSSSGAARAPAAAAPAVDAAERKQATEADIDLTKSIGIKAGDPIMAEIVERFPNGNYKVNGSKKVPYRSGYRYVSVLGIVRAADVTDEETVPSGKIYEYRLEATR